MANHEATGKKAKHGANLIQRSRAAVLNALDVVESRGKPISEILADEFINNPIKFMELASKLSPKEIDAKVSHEVIDNLSELTDDELRERIADCRNRIDKRLGERGAIIEGVTEKESTSKPNNVH